LDGKGRIALPARLRHKLRDAGIHGLVLTTFDGSLKLYPPEYFRAHVEEPIARMDPFDAQVQILHHAILAGATDCPVDKQGRLRIPAELREEAGLEAGCEVVLISMLDWIEIFEKRAWQERRAFARTHRNRARAEVLGTGD
jgi:MraZ protein